MRLGILTSHPIQYQAPWFRALARRTDLHVFFAHAPDAAQQGAGFDLAFTWDVDLLAGYPYTVLANRARHPDVARFWGCNTPEIAELIREGDFDAFIVSGWHLRSYWQAIHACHRFTVPVLVRGDSQLGTPRSLFRRLLKPAVYRVLLRQFDGFLTVGQRNREYLEHYGVHPDLISFSPHFVDNDWFATLAAQTKSRRMELRAMWGAVDTTLVALYVGKFQKRKRPFDLLDAVARTRDVVAVFVGSGELDSELPARSSARGVPAVFPGFKNQSALPEYYSAADVLVLPSDGRETWGLVVNEAMACGTPAIVSDAVGCAPDLLEDGVTGFTYPIGDVRTLSDRLLRMIALKKEGHDWQPALANKMRRYSVSGAVEGAIHALEQALPTR